jgi:hypothetical protein
MEGKTTKQMFQELTDERNWHQNIDGLNPASARRLKSDSKNGKVSTDKMEEILTKAGCNVLQEKLWSR